MHVPNTFSFLFFITFTAVQFMIVNDSAQLVGGFTLSDLLDKPCAQVSSLLCTYIQYIHTLEYKGRTGRSSVASY